MGERTAAGGGVRGRECKLTYLLRAPEKHHRFGINSLALSVSDGGKSLYTAGRDSVIRIWDVTTTSAESSTSRSLEGHIDWVNDVLVFSCRGAIGGSEKLVSCSSDTTLRIWNPAKGTRIHTVIEHSDYVKALAAVDTTTIASGALDSRVCLWDTETWKLKGECGGEEGVKGSVYCLAGNGVQNSSLVVVGSTNRIVSVWDARSGEKIAKLKGHNDSVRSVALRQDGMQILSGGSDSLIRLWDLRQQRELRWYDPHADSVWALSASKDFSWFLSGGRDGSVFRTDTETAESSLVVGSIGSEKDNIVLSIAKTADESGVWTSSTGSSVKLWKIGAGVRVNNGTGEEIDVSKLETKPLATIPGLPGIVSYQIMNNRRHVLTKDSNGEVVLWDITRASSLTHFGVRNLEEVAKELEEEVVVPSWFSIEIRLGSLGVKLDRNCFNAEIYAVDAGLEAESEEYKVNIGEHVLKAMFKWWKTSYDSTRGNPQEDDPNPGNQNKFSDYVLPKHTKIIISEEGSPIPTLQKEAGALVAADEEFIPRWILDTVRDGRPVTKEGPKMSFLLQPEQVGGMRRLGHSKLSAPRVLRVRKVIAYLVKELFPEDESFSQAPVEVDVEIVCNGRVIEPAMSLGSVKQFVWRDPGDLELTYRLKAGSSARTDNE
uniref:WD repeat-containing protein 48 homolog n=2 Tax=Rhodosorus marinus TaxID=101924 RepID=A0A7S2ZPI8_9RHOD|mmetsp:Transcript_25404/g.100293  ORF Transcript_25404/g.100293 Transcript_25404/m.100293 type:complete len:658 (+) Transcript_25404:333-2306(+)|eukprot:CAMPEP_0113957448 /NCGR_PEP_ID=MMETSP0011_2-20120614/2786_1 /TAXON_ID=101924 /ORGANISM="Rhodosorus marinus" /LENGTH=657 /DNA_ID=CAMNT_0000968033 /DNA_START=246 /DNA_END=2219 /DNA_ORIENTATION=- /assembly_acc=CAM_ASM_000156